MKYGQIILNGLSNSQVGAIFDFIGSHANNLHIEVQAIRPEGQIAPPPFPPPFPPPNIMPPPQPPVGPRPFNYPAYLPWPPNQPPAPPPPLPPPPPFVNPPDGVQVYDNVVVTWSDDGGFAAVKDMLNKL